jgi:hyperosmotically inducible periplasmic protein
MTTRRFPQSQKSIWRRSLASVSILFGGLTFLYIQPQAVGSHQNADNTKMNESAGVTADQQKNDAADIDLTRRIRKSIVQDKSLSVDAHNVKVISRDGIVTLRGAVNSDTEKTIIDAKAVAVAGQGKVNNELRIISKKPDS